VGDNDVRATKEDIKKMKYLLEEELEKGAIGVTCGLEYTVKYPKERNLIFE
jgi:N-acyl-D-aspartate/D-glutamate deacylase